MPKDLYDVIIIGGGPAGLSAAVYLSRFLRKTLVIDSGHGRSTCYEVNENYLGFPQGIAIQKLRKLGEKQAKRFGTTFVFSKVTHLKRPGKEFEITCSHRNYLARTVIIATGVEDFFPDFSAYEEYIGTSLFWCITCDGYKVQGKKVAVVGSEKEAVITALQLLRFTKDIIFITNRKKGVISQIHVMQKILSLNNISLLEGEILSVKGENGKVREVTITNHKPIKIEYIFSSQGARPNSSLAQDIGAEVTEAEYIKVDLEQRTTAPFVYAAGDVTRNFSHQVATAVHEGSMAAQAANYDLYEPLQRGEFILDQS